MITMIPNLKMHLIIFSYIKSRKMDDCCVVKLSLELELFILYLLKMETVR